MRSTFYLMGMESDYTIHWYSLFLLTLPTILRLAYDYYTIVNKKTEVNHLQHTLITSAGMIIVSCIVWRLEPIKYLFQPFLLSTGIFVLFFDYLLSVLRGKNPFYIDEGKDGKQSYADRVYERIGPIGTAFFKLWYVLVVICFYFYWTLITGERIVW